MAKRKQNLFDRNTRNIVDNYNAMRRLDTGIYKFVHYYVLTGYVYEYVCVCMCDWVSWREWDTESMCRYSVCHYVCSAHIIRHILCAMRYSLSPHIPFLHSCRRRRRRSLPPSSLLPFHISHSSIHSFIHSYTSFFRMPCSLNYWKEEKNWFVLFFRLFVWLVYLVFLSFVLSFLVHSSIRIVFVLLFSFISFCFTLFISSSLFHELTHSFKVTFFQFALKLKWNNIIFKLLLGYMCVLYPRSTTKSSKTITIPSLLYTEIAHT